MNLEQITHSLFTLSDTSMILISKFGIERKFVNYNIPYQMKGIIDSNREFVKQKTIDYKVYRFKDNTELAYCSFKVLESTLIMGPFLEKKVNAKVLKELSLRLKLIQSEFAHIESFYQSLSIISEEELDFIYNVISNITHTKFRPPEYIHIELEDSLSNRSFFKNELHDQTEKVIQSFNVEQQFITIIESGDVYKAEDFNSSYLLSQTTLGEGDSLQDEKIRLTILDTLCNRAAIRGGIDIQFAHQISKNFEILINSMNTVKECEDLSQDIIVEYTWAVKNYSLLRYSNLIRNAVLHIRRNIKSAYGLGVLAGELRVSKEHLAREFKKETGKTVSSYIQYTKIIEAKVLLKSSKHSIADISNILGFSNSTYFSRIFKKHIGLSPKQYVSRNLK